jgi:uncharacterized membrane protein
MTEQDQGSTAPKPSDGELAVATDGAYYLIVGRFPDTEAATKAYEELKRLEQTTTLAIDGVVVARRDTDGKVRLDELTEHSTKSGTKWGIAGGIALAVFFPPSILAGAVAGGAIGGAAGKIRNLRRRSDLEKELEDVLTPGSSGVVALVEDKAAVEVEKALATADAIVSKSIDRAVAMDIEAEAARAKAEAGV